jgi:hypothetical protein
MSKIELHLDESRLTEKQVRDRLASVHSAETAEEIYEFGEKLLKDATERVKGLESKAASFAGYGIAVVTLLVSSSASWSKIGDRWSFWIAAIAGLFGFLCTFFSIRVLQLSVHTFVSQSEWLEEKSITGELSSMHKYRVLTIWGSLDSYTQVHLRKALDLRRAERCLMFAASGLLAFLLQLALIYASQDTHGASLR